MGGCACWRRKPIGALCTVSVEAIFGTLGPVLTRWTMGGAALGDAPAVWKEALAGDEAELGLLALSGQFLGVFALPVPSGALRPLPDLPTLAIPPVPDPLRPLTRRCLKALQSDGSQSAFIDLLAVRGYMMHPADWLPGRNDEDLPAVYAPLQDWVAGAVGRADADAALSEETWSDFAPAARARAFAALRRTDPDVARALLEAKAASELADIRLRLIGLLADGLSANDVPYLRALANDRAPRIKWCAAGMLARLGHGPNDAQEANELAAFFRIETKGLLRRTRVVTPNPIKTHAQRVKRQELFGRVGYAALERALGIEDLVATWPFGDDDAVDSEFQTMVAQSAEDSVIAAIFTRLATSSTLDVSAMQRLRGRLDTSHRLHVAALILKSNQASFARARLFADAGAELDGLIDTRAGSALLAAAKGGADIVVEVHALGLIASRAAAQAAVDGLTRVGLNAADPRLDLLRLSASLTPTGAAA